MGLGFFIGGEEVRLLEAVYFDGEKVGVPEARLVFLRMDQSMKLEIVVRGKVEVERLRRGDIWGRRIADRSEEEPELDPTL